MKIFRCNECGHRKEEKDNIAFSLCRYCVEFMEVEKEEKDG